MKIITNVLFITDESIKKDSDINSLSSMTTNYFGHMDRLGEFGHSRFYGYIAIDLPSVKNIDVKSYFDNIASRVDKPAELNDYTLLVIDTRKTNGIVAPEQTEAYNVIKAALNKELPTLMVRSFKAITSQGLVPYE